MFGKYLFRRKTCTQITFGVLAVTIFVHFFIPYLHYHRQNRINVKSPVNDEPVDPNYMFNLKEFLGLFPHVNFSGNISDEINLRDFANLSIPSKDKLCEFPPKMLRGRELVQRDLIKSMDAIEEMHQDSEIGGHFSPNCIALASVAIIVPYRNRDQHLRQFLYNVIPKLKRQNLEFTIYVVEQKKGSNFNRGMLRNIGFHEAHKISNYSCYIFNDVDTISEDDRNIYMCSPDVVRHFVTGIDREKYRMPYANLLGGIIGFTGEQFQKINGYSNLYFQWGAEDDDLCRRIMKADLHVKRPPKTYGYITTLPHKKDPKLMKRMQIYRTVGSLADSDGLNSLQYKVIDVKKYKLYTWIYVDINEEKVMKEYNSIPKSKLAGNKADKACSPIRF